MVELADIPGGYGWVFPKGDHVNVGVGAWQAEGPRLREHLERRLRGARACARTSSTSVRGHRLPLRRPATRIAGERALLVGDAAGLIDPVSGDGMYECFVSASLAASAIGDLLAGRASSLERLLGRGRRRGRPAASRFVAAQARARPLAGGELADRAHAISSGARSSGCCWPSCRRPGEQRGLARVPLRGLELLSRRRRLAGAGRAVAREVARLRGEFVPPLLSATVTVICSGPGDGFESAVVTV